MWDARKIEEKAGYWRRKRHKWAKRQILVPDLSVKRKIDSYFWPFLLFYGHLWAIICELTAILRRIELFYNCFLERNGQIWD